MRAISSFVLLGLISACATTAPREPSASLLAARRAYAVAESTVASELVPEELRAARALLDEAEAAHQKEPQGEAEQHHAYLAYRRIQTAAALADFMVAREITIQALRYYEQAGGGEDPEREEESSAR